MGKSENNIMEVTKEKSGLRFTNLTLSEHDRRKVTVLTLSVPECTLIILNGYVPQPEEVPHVHLTVREDGFAKVDEMPRFVKRAFREKLTLPFITFADDSGKVEHFQADTEYYPDLGERMDF